MIYIMVIIYAEIDVDPAGQHETLANSVAFANESLGERGCIGYLFTLDSQKPGLMYVLERWENDEDLEAHMHTARSADFAKWMTGVARKVRVNRYTVSDDKSDSFRQASTELMGDSVET